MPAEPRVSVIIPAYNAERYLSATLESLRAQTVGDWIATVVDDGSEDGTVEIAQRFAAGDPRIQLLQQSNKGASAARNLAMRTAPAEFYAFLDADDLWLPDKLERQLAAVEEQGVDFVFCSYQGFDDQGREWQDQDWSRRAGLRQGRSLLLQLSVVCFILPSSVLLSQRLISELGDFDESLQMAEDWDLFLRIVCAGHAFYGLWTDPHLVRRRSHPVSSSTRHSLMFFSHHRMIKRFQRVLPEKTRRRTHRLTFRNAFTVEGDQRRFEELVSMFDAYRTQDPSGYACRVMAVLRRLLPVRAFWFLSRYAVIPLAWHLEMWADRSPRFARRSPPGGE